VTAPKLLNLVQIAELLDVTKQRGDQLRRRADFPAPAGRSIRGDLWAAADVRRWARSYYGPSGRPKPRRP
jgi:hypothetical protein